MADFNFPNNFQKDNTFERLAQFSSGLTRIEKFKASRNLGYREKLFPIKDTFDKVS